MRGPGVAHEVDEPFGAAQIGHQSETGFGHTEPRVSADDAEIAGQGQLEASANGVPSDRRDADQPRFGEPAEPGLKAREDVIGLVRRAVGQRANGGLRIGDQAAVYSGREGGAGTSYEDKTARPGVRYVYAIVAVDKASPPNRSAPSARVEETAR